MSYKTKAYRKVKNGFELITRDYICSLAYEDQIIFRDTNKPFYLVASEDGPELTYNTKNRTFSFYPSFTGKYYASNEESATHKYCIEEISKFNNLKIKSKNSFGNVAKGEYVNFSFNYIFPEIILPIGDNWIKPDLLVYFREPYDLALKWNRILAIEIVVSHDLNGEKLKLMKDYKIPVLRIKANKKWGRQKEENMSNQKKEELKNWIKNSFQKGYSAEVLLDSKSKAYLENKVIRKLEDKNSLLTQKLEKSSEYISRLENEKSIFEDKLSNTRFNSNIYKTKFNDKTEEVKKIKINLKNILDFNKRLKKRLTNLSVVSLGIISCMLLIIYLK